MALMCDPCFKTRSKEGGLEELTIGRLLKPHEPVHCEFCHALLDDKAWVDAHEVKTSGTQG